MVNEYPTAGKPAVVLDAGGRVCAVARMDAKAFRKSLESGPSCGYCGRGGCCRWRQPAA